MGVRTSMPLNSFNKMLLHDSTHDSTHPKICQDGIHRILLGIVRIPTSPSHRRNRSTATGSNPPPVPVAGSKDFHRIPSPPRSNLTTSRGRPLRPHGPTKQKAPPRPGAPMWSFCTQVSDLPHWSRSKNTPDMEQDGMLQMRTGPES